VARLTSIAGFTLQLAAITAAGVVIAYVSMAFWYWRSRIPTLNTDAPISACYRAPAARGLSLVDAHIGLSSDGMSHFRSSYACGGSSYDCGLPRGSRLCT
jgi:hypothetical protein